MAFDLEEQRYNLDQARSELQEAEQEIVKLQADARVQAANDQVALLDARRQARRAGEGQRVRRQHRGREEPRALEETSRRSPSSQTM